MGAFLTFFIATTKIVILPPLVLKGVFVLVDQHPDLLPTALAHLSSDILPPIGQQFLQVLSYAYVRVFLQVLSVPIFFFGREAWRKWKYAREAKRMGGVPVPCAKGKWPGNIDIVVRLVRGLRTRYAAAVHKELLEVCSRLYLDYPT